MPKKKIYDINGEMRYKNFEKEAEQIKAAKTKAESQKYKLSILIINKKVHVAL